MLRTKPALTVMLTVALLCVARAASGADAMFMVSGVHVDARGYSASVAQSVAFAQGRPKAWQIMFRRLTRQQDWGKQPQLDDTHLQRLMRNFTITNERRSTTQYTADISYNFNPAAVARVLRDANIAFAQSTAHRILLVPMNPVYARGSAWTNAFTAPRFAESLVPFTLPLSDAVDAGALAHLNFETANWFDIADVALRVRATEAVLVLLQTEPGAHRLSVSLKRVGLGQQPTQSSTSVPYIQTALSTYPAAADAAVSAIAEMWKQHVAVDFSKTGSIVVDVRVSTLAQWASVQAALATVSNVTSIRVLDMDIGEARMSLGYLGTPEQLHDALGQAGLQLVNADPATNSGGWILEKGSPSSPEPGQKPAPASLRP